MITTILIVLVAVVVLIVIIAVLALRYLRADDSDTFDDIPDEPRRPSRGLAPGSDQLPAEPSRRSRQRPAAVGAWAADRPSRPVDAHGRPGYRDHDTGPRPTVPERAGSQVGGQRRAAAASASPVRPTRPARADESDSATSSWESLSDVDYWAELAADKAPVSPVGSGQTPAARRPRETSADLRPPAGTMAAARGERGQPPVQQRPQPIRPAAPLPSRVPDSSPTASSPEARGRHSGSRPAVPQRPATPGRGASGPHQVLPTRPQPAAAQAPSGNGHFRNGRGDDDPLTSPSFPAINAADSRSYRTRRPANSQPGVSGPNGYPVQTPSQQPIPAQQASALSASAPAGQKSPRQTSPRQSPPAQPGAPAANPYGSYVSAPQPAYQPPTYQQASHPDTATGGRSAPDYTGHPSAPLPAPAGNWYSALEPGGSGGSSATDGYLSAAGLNGAGSGTGRHAHNGSAPRGYTGIDYGSLRYDDQVYPDAQAGGLAGYAAPAQPAAQYEQYGYGGPDVGYPQDGQQGNSGYGADRR